MHATHHSDDVLATFTANAECQGVGGDGSPAYNAPVNIQIATLELFGRDAMHLLKLCPQLTLDVLALADELEFEGDER